MPPTSDDPELTPPTLEQMAELIAKAFDVPPEVLGLPPAPKPPLLASGGILAGPFHWDEHIEHWEHLGTAKDFKPSPASNHAWGTALDTNAPEGVMHQHFDPEPGAMYLEGDGDLDAKPKAKYLMSFDVLGKAQPVVASQIKTQIWETPLGKVTKQPLSGMVSVQLWGTVSTAQGSFQLGADLVTEDLELAKKLIGAVGYESAGAGTGPCFLNQAAGGQLFTWEAGIGWIPKDPAEPIYAQGNLLDAFPTEFSVQKGGVTFPKKELTFADYPDLEPFPVEHTGPDGSLWTFKFEGGWRRSAVEESLFGGGGMAPHGWFCSYCKQHVEVHAGDLIGCDSGGWLRPATASEHKLALLQK